MPAPAVIHCVAPSVITPPPPFESRCLILPSIMYVTVSKPRCGWSGAPLASPGAYSTAPMWSSSRNGSAQAKVDPGEGPPHLEALALEEPGRVDHGHRLAGEAPVRASRDRGRASGSSGVTAGMSPVTRTRSRDIPVGTPGSLERMKV